MFINAKILRKTQDDRERDRALSRNEDVRHFVKEKIEKVSLAHGHKVIIEQSLNKWVTLELTDAGYGVREIIRGWDGRSQTGHDTVITW